MERHPKQLHVRMSDREMESAKSVARELGMTVSDLVRILLQLPAGEARGGARLVVVDRTTTAKLSREMTRWGHHYNQAVHALNAIAYYLRANDMETSEVIEELSRAERKLAEMQPGVESLRRAVVELSGSVLAGLGR
jgi:antitoxin component of RelBE/YafQ-DinJ toxin-antitoxin module